MLGGRGSCNLQQDPATERGTKGTLIRHAGISPSVAIRALTVPMIESSLETLLMAKVGETPLLPIGLLAAKRAATAVPSGPAPAQSRFLAAPQTLLDFVITLHSLARFSLWSVFRRIR